jgi:hypothetical protein
MRRSMTNHRPQVRSKNSAQVHTRLWRGRNGREVTFVYLELPDVRRASSETLGKRLGDGAKKNLHKNGIVRDEEFAEKLLANRNQV